MAYEISILQRELDSTTNTFKYYKSLTIGTDQMEYQGRAIEPKLTSSTNGTHTFTFNMYYKFIDIITGKSVQNEYVPYLKNETQLLLNLDGTQYLFTIKAIKKDSKNCVLNFTCEDSFIDELSKNGYDIEFDQSLNNNYGTATELAAKALADSDWTIDGYGDKFYEMTEETLVRAIVSQEFSAYKINNGIPNTEATTINVGTNVLLFYSSCNSDTNRVQFIIPSNPIELEKGTKVIKDNSNQYYIDLDQITFRRAPTSFSDLGLTTVQICNNSEWKTLFTPNNEKERLTSNYYVISEYRGRRYVFNPRHEYNSKLGQIADIFYRYGQQSEDHKFLRVRKTEIQSGATVVNNITNSSDFTSTSGWRGGKDDGNFGLVAEIEAINENENGQSILDDLTTVSPDIITKSTYTPYLKIQFHNSHSLVYNSGFYDNREIISNLVNGDVYRCRLITKDNDQVLDNYEIIVGNYTINSLTNTYTITNRLLHFDLSNGTDQTAIVSGSIYTPETFKSNKNKIGVFIKRKTEVDESIGSASELFIKELQIFKYYGENIYPNNETINTQVLSKYYFYNVNELKKVTDSEKIQPEFVTTIDAYKISYDDIPFEAPLSAEKYKSITVSKSNYFNIIQTICETFECWVKFNVYIDSEYNIEKRISFHKYAGGQNNYGIKYSVNLDSIQRTDKTDQLVTKLIVSANSQEMAENSFCSITDATTNPTGENILYNFDYFIKKGEINAAEYQKDLYDLTGAEGKDINITDKQTNVNGFYVRLADLNSDIKKNNKYISDLSGTLKEINSKVEAKQQLVLQADQGVTDSIADFESALGFKYSDINVQSEVVKFTNEGKLNYDLNSLVTRIDSIRFEDMPVKETIGDIYWEFNASTHRLIFKTDDVILKINHSGRLEYWKDNISYSGDIIITQSYRILIDGSNQSTELIEMYKNVDNLQLIKEETTIDIDIIGSSTNHYTLPYGATTINLIKDSENNTITPSEIIFDKGITYIPGLTEGGTYTLSISGTFYYLQWDSEEVSDPDYKAFKGFQLNTINTRIINTSKSDTIYLYGKPQFYILKSQNTLNFDQLKKIRDLSIELNEFELILDDFELKPSLFFYRLKCKRAISGLIHPGQGSTIILNYNEVAPKYDVITTTKNKYLLYGYLTEPKLEDYTVKKSYSGTASTSRLEKAKSEHFKKYLDNIGLYQLQLTNARQELNTLESQQEQWQELVEDAQQENQTLIKYKQALNAAFYKKYHSFIKEGTWIDEKYYDPNEYYQDAQQVLYNSCFPIITYSISVANVPEMNDIRLGNTTFVEDGEFFGFDSDGTPNQEEVVVTEVVNNLDNPSANSIKVQTVRNQFQDLFQAIQATVQSLTYAQGGYERAAELAEADYNQRTKFLQDAFNKSALAALKTNQSVTQDGRGIVIIDSKEQNKQLIINSNGLIISTDGGNTWKTGFTSQGVAADVITAGHLNAGSIEIYNGDTPTFKWDSFGLTAYWFDTNNINNSYITNINHQKGVRFDRFGVYGYNYTDQLVFNPTNMDDIEKNSMFYLTWDGLNVKYIDNKENQYYTKIGKIDTQIYNDWNNETGLPFYNNESTDSNFIPIVEVGLQDNPSLRIYSDGTIVCSQLKVTGSIGYATAASPNQTVYHQGIQELIKPNDNTYYNQFNDKSDNEWHKIKTDSDKYYATTTDGGATWSGPYLLSGIENYQIELSTTQTAFYNSEGSTTITARVYLNENEITEAIGSKDGPYSKYSFKWLQDETEIQNNTTNSITINASSISNGSDNITCILVKTE